jgi:cation diffusion facilitator CzcD-associated flavoprotein CzcO
MTALEQLGRVESADILVIGGGIGGLAAATAAKEKSPDADVLVVEKGVTGGWPANKGPASGGTRARGRRGPFVKFHASTSATTSRTRTARRLRPREPSWSAWTAGRAAPAPRRRSSTSASPFLPELTGGLTHARLRARAQAGVRFIDKTSLPTCSPTAGASPAPSASAS